MKELLDAIAAGRYEAALSLAGKIPPRAEALPELRRALKLAHIARARLSSDLRCLPRVYGARALSFPQQTWTA